MEWAFTTAEYKMVQVYDINIIWVFMAVLIYTARKIYMCIIMFKDKPRPAV